MALSYEDVDLVLATGTILANFQSGHKDLSQADQETALACQKLILALIDDPRLISFKDLFEFTKGDLTAFLSEIPPSIMGDVAGIIEKIIANERLQKQIKELHDFLIDYLLRRYSADEKFSWKDVIQKERVPFAEYAHYVNLASDYAAYLALREEARLPTEERLEEEKTKEVEAAEPEAEIEETKEIPTAATAAVPTAVIAANVKLLLADKEAQDEINRRIDEKLAKENIDTRNLIKRLVALQIVRRTVLEIAKNASQKDNAALAEINQEVNSKPKDAPEPLIAAISRDLINFVLPQVEKEQKIQITVEQRGETVKNLADIIVASAAIGEIDVKDDVPLRLDIKDPVIRDQIVQIALAEAVPEFSSPVADLHRQVEEKVVLITPTPRYDLPAMVQITPQIAIANLETIILPPVTLPPVTFNLPAPIEDKIEQAQIISEKFVTAVILNSKTEQVMDSLTGSITQTQGNQLTQILIGANLLTRVASTQKAETVATVYEKLAPVNPLVAPIAIRLLSMGYDQKKVDQEITVHPTSKLAQFFRERPKIKEQLDRSLHHLENPKNELGLEISPRLRQQAAQAGTPPPHLPAPTPPGALSNIGRQIQSASNQISGFLPGRAGRIFNFITHPFQSIQSYIGRQFGNRIAAQFTNLIAQKFVSRIANETLKKGAEFLLKEGLQKGVQKLGALALEKIGATAVVAGLSAALGVSTAGISLIIQAALMVGAEVAKKVFGLVNDMVTSIYGKPLEARDLLAVPLLAVAGIGGVLGSLATVTAVAASSAAIIIMGSTFVGFILYITVIGIAPVIAGIAHLESAQGAPYSVVSGGVVPEGCPSGWPLASGYVTQGPRTTSTHRNVEAIDVGVGLGTPIIATHNGLGRYDPSLGPYGNFVDVSGTCNGIAFTTRYAHMVTGAFSGEKLVQKGEIIGYVNSTGNSTGNHLHYEIRGGNLGDINQFLPKRVAPGCIDYGNCQVNLP
ncbi:hypothetical protein A3A84_00710 [Candidatus Collierbacteria bacterium RIFCSPLOWO2_01_FULL_50_23]|nr:MAG: hypothetical protein A3A84_00710 [Candidatus Collierbacteria bacterium RIFCSPLOWO2_01_FULL_50_23]